MLNQELGGKMTKMPLRLLMIIRVNMLQMTYYSLYKVYS